MTVRRDGGLLHPEPTTEIIITLYDNRTVGFQTNSFRGHPPDPHEIMRLLSLMAGSVQQSIHEQAAPAPAGQVDEGHGFELFAEPDPAAP